MRLILGLVMALLPSAASAQDPRPKPADVGATIKRGLAFLVKDALAWKNQHKCVSCHHAALVVWSLREARQRGHVFLIKAQRRDGSWPMTSRPVKPGGPGSKSLIPITGAGSAWAVLGLVRSLPVAATDAKGRDKPATPAKQSRALLRWKRETKGQPGTKRSRCG
jgi:hypothetical protein